MKETYEDTLEGQTEMLKDGLAEGESSDYFVGVAYGAIVDLCLAEKAGYRNARAYLESVFKTNTPSEATLRRCAAVARNFTEAHARQYGITRLNALITYVNVTDVTHPPAYDPASITIRVPKRFEETGEEVLVDTPFAECSAAEINAAVRYLKREELELSPADAERIRRIQEAIDAAMHEHVALKVRLSRDGTPYVSLDFVPLHGLADAAKAIARADAEPALKAAG
jgi:hypothetical protein